MIIRYDSTAALRQAYIDLNVSNSSGFSGNSWYGNETEADTLRKAEVGDMSLVAKAEDQLNKLDSAIETPRLIWERSVAGAFCVVPDVLAGLPTPMRRQTHQRDETNPITILAVTTSSAGISAYTLAQRGTTILALVLALSRIRPVTLHQLTLLDGDKDRSGETIITSEINTHPIDLATACYVLTSAGFARRLTYGLAKRLNNFTGGWPRNYQYGKDKNKYYDYLAQVLAPDPKRCLVIGAAELHDELLSEPITWLNKQITKFTTAQEEGFAP
jgi:hypothetical protein